MKGASEIVSVVWVGREKGISHTASTPATYLGIFDDIRRFFAGLSEAKARCFTPSHFSFNSKSGQCPVCKGAGEERVKLDFLSDVSNPCESCAGSRYHKKVLSVTFKNVSISQVLELSFLEARSLFEGVPKIQEKLEMVIRLGLGYLPLGQGSHTLSGGESQRLLVTRDVLLGAGKDGVYLFDEPGKGLHVEDLQNLFALFDLLQERGNTLVVIDHNPHLIARAQWIIDLGPGAGEQGGDLVYQGELAGLMKEKRSATGAYLKKLYLLKRQCCQA